MSGTLLLGPVLFRDFELPERIAWGGRQRLALHRLPGGGRVIDAMGRDDAPIVWNGVLSGEDAAVTARLLDTMRADGGEWPLTWGWFLYLVVIERFEVSYERSNWMPYSISCAVVQDIVGAAADSALSLIEGAASDLAVAGGLVGDGGFAGAQGAVAAMRQTPGAASAAGPIAAAALAVETGIGAIGARLTGAPDGSSLGLLDAVDDAGSLARATAARGHARRALGRVASANI